MTDRAANVVYVMLYIGAVEGFGRYLAPKHVYRMTDEQAVLTSDAERRNYATTCLKPGFMPSGPTWYADNTREPVRDETLKNGLMVVGAVVRLSDLPPTSPKPTYALARSFAELFEPGLAKGQLEQQIEAWRALHLTADSKVRSAIVNHGASNIKGRVAVEFPSGERRMMSPGPSSIISKAVIEEFATRFLDRPAVLWLSESRRKVVECERKLANQLGLKINEAELLPDIILADLRESGDQVLLVFVEVVATDGPITPHRRAELLRLAEGTELSSKQVAFVTAFEDRGKPVTRKLLNTLAWNSFVWFASEPDHLVAMHPADPRAKLHRLLHL